MWVVLFVFCLVLSCAHYLEKQTNEESVGLAQAGIR